MPGDKGITPAVRTAHGVTTSMYYQDPDRNFVELQIDRFAEPDPGHRLHGTVPEYAADSAGAAKPADLEAPRKLLTAYRAGASVEELSKIGLVGAPLRTSQPASTC